MHRAGVVAEIERGRRDQRRQLRQRAFLAEPEGRRGRRAGGGRDQGFEMGAFAFVSDDERAQAVARVDFPQAGGEALGGPRLEPDVRKPGRGAHDVAAGLEPVLRQDVCDQAAFRGLEG